MSGKSSDKNESAQMEEGHKVSQALDEQGRNCKEVASLASKIKNNVDL